MTGKEIIALVVTLVGFCNTGYYIFLILKKRIRAHVFSWIVWGLTQTIGAAAQFADGGGAGAWPTMIAGLSCFGLALLSVFYHGERNITRSDWISFLISLAAIPFWVTTNNPLWASVLVSFSDTSGVYPTFRKSWHSPYEESLLMFFIAALGYVFVLVALENYTLTTTLYPLASIVSNGVLVVMLAVRRAVLKKEAAHA